MKNGNVWSADSFMLQAEVYRRKALRRGRAGSTSQSQENVRIAACQGGFRIGRDGVRAKQWRRLRIKNEEKRCRLS